MLVYPSHTNEFWEGRHTCLQIGMMNITRWNLCTKENKFRKNVSLRNSKFKNHHQESKSKYRPIQQCVVIFDTELEFWVSQRCIFSELVFFCIWSMFRLEKDLGIYVNTFFHKSCHFSQSVQYMKQSIINSWECFSTPYFFKFSSKDEILNDSS